MISSERRLIGCMCLLITVRSAAAQTEMAPAGAISVTSSTVTPWNGNVDVSDPGSPYDSAALRLEEHGGSTRIIRGVRGPVLWSQGLLFTSGDLERVVAPSATALAQARVFQQKNRRGTRNFALGLSAWAVSLVISAHQPSTPKYVASTILGFAGGGLMFYSHRDRNAAATALSRAVLLYNRDLPR